MINRKSLLLLSCVQVVFQFIAPATITFVEMYHVSLIIGPTTEVVVNMRMGI